MPINDNVVIITFNPLSTFCGYARLAGDNEFIEFHNGAVLCKNALYSTWTLGDIDNLCVVMSIAAQQPEIRLKRPLMCQHE